jgi:hypothetical protein
VRGGQFESVRDGKFEERVRGRRGKFAFHSIQWALLPVLYRPSLRFIGSQSN